MVIFWFVVGVEDCEGGMIIVSFKDMKVFCFDLCIDWFVIV